MKNNLIYYSFLLLACVTGLKQSALAQCGVTPSSAVICITGGSSTAVLNAGASGTWSTSDATVAQIISGLPSSSCTISTNSVYGVATITFDDGVNPPCDVPVYAGPYAGAITGPSAVCSGSTINLSSNVPGGTWSSSTGACSVNAFGVVTGVTAGTSLIYYTVSTCGGDARFKFVTVDVPVSPNITSKPASLCGGSMSLSASPPLGSWSSSVPPVASVSGAGMVTTGAANGTTVIKYEITNACGTYDDHFTLQHGPYAGTISGPSALCTGVSGTITLTDPVPGGTWSCSGVNATVSSIGVVTGTNAGTEMITYTVPYCGGAFTTHMVTVTQTPATPTISPSIPGQPDMMCLGGVTLTYSGNPATGGYSWATSNAGVATVSGGVVTAVGAGVCDISYGITNTCGVMPAVVSVTVDVTAIAGTISGTSLLCMAGPTSTTLTTTGSGGAWSANGDGTITSGGLVTATAPGAIHVVYNVNNGCGVANANYTVTVGGAFSLGGSASICEGSTLTLIDLTPGGTWTNTNSGAATVSASLVTAVAAGSTTLSYTSTTGCGTFSDGIVITVNPLPHAGVVANSLTPIPYYIPGGATYGTFAVTGDAGGYWTSTFPGCITFTGPGASAGPTYGTLYAEDLSYLNAGCPTCFGACGGYIYYTITNSCGTDSTPWFPGAPGSGNTIGTTY